ncbi:MAG: Ig-like domain-containing protein, partial [Gallionella sp.]
LAQTAGTVTSDVDGGFTYTPPLAGFASVDTGVDAFTYRAFDGVDYSYPTTVTINVLANRAPVAATDTLIAPVYIATQVYADVLIDVLKNDTDPDAVFDPENGIVESSVSIVAAPANGMAMVDPVTGIISYTPNENFRGVDIIRYNVKDAHDAISNTAMVRVIVR